jgi:UDP-3-O-[3-hydroxymyristoyl] glucosamine N-acyltransferase
MKSIPDGEIWCGAPARPLRRFMRETAWLAKHAVRGDGGE